MYDFARVQRPGTVLARSKFDCEQPARKGSAMKLLVRATNWVGDAVMSIPALEAIRAKWPQAEITVLARQWVADLYQGQAFADRVIALASSGRSALGKRDDAIGECLTLI